MLCETALRTCAPQSNQKPKSAKAAKKKQKEPSHACTAEEPRDGDRKFLVVRLRLPELQPLPPGPCVGQAAQGLPATVVELAGGGQKLEGSNYFDGTAASEAEDRLLGVLNAPM